MPNRTRSAHRAQLVVLLPILSLLTALGFAAGCGDAPSDPSKEAAAATAPASTPTADGEVQPPAAPAQRDESATPIERRRNERPLPAFGGRTLDSKEIQISEFLGKRLMLYFFNPEVQEAEAAGPAFASLQKLQTRHNFTILGIAIGSDGEAARAYAKRFGLEFPIIDDSNALITQRFNLRSPFIVIGADREGYFTWGVQHISTQAPNAAALFEDEIRDELRLPEREAQPSQLAENPLAPTFTTETLGGDDFDFASLDGQAKVLIFFLHTCGHCHAALASLKESLAKLEEDHRPRIIGVSLVPSASAVRPVVEEQGWDFLEIIIDESGELAEKYGIFGGVPVLNFIDSSGRIIHRIQGWDKKRDPPLARMYLAKIGGGKVPMLLNRQGYTGNDVCGVCHSMEYATWEFTQHATAFDTLVKHGVDRDPECVGCHSVGFEQAGGFQIDTRPAHLEGVGCESCHGRGGGHLPDTEKITDFENQACKTCHNPTHSLGFEYASFRPRISHTGILALSPEQRASLVADRAKPRDVLPTQAAYVGSEACQSCHASEFETWGTSPHGNALASLEKDGKTGDPDCLKCHTTAFGRSGGFPKDGNPSDHADLARVGCESCHGPGGDHIDPDAAKIGTIVSLGDKCDSCVILQICGSCHDDANDPDFEFEVQERIERQRHGTIEAGTGKPLGESAQLPDDLPSQLAVALAAAEAR